VALAEMCFGVQLGADIEIDDIPHTEELTRPDFILFSESNSRFVVEVAPEDTSAFEEIMKEIPHGAIGHIIKNSKLMATFRGKTVLNANLKPLKNAWQSTMEDYF
jgi:phosphoribosylformylglycinamidine synthase